jgi:Holliday junction resolvase-like predicted endonuclease
MGKRRYTRRNRPKIGIRTLNETEIEACKFLEGLGYTVVKRGWPDFLAVRGDEVRFVEVKSSPNNEGLSPNQKKVARILEKLGIRVELFHPGNKQEWEGNHLRKGEVV